MVNDTEVSVVCVMVGTCSADTYRSAHTRRSHKVRGTLSWAPRFIMDKYYGLFLWVFVIAVSQVVKDPVWHFPAVVFKDVHIVLYD